MKNLAFSCLPPGMEYAALSHCIGHHFSIQLMLPSWAVTSLIHQPEMGLFKIVRKRKGEKKLIVCKEVLRMK